MVVSVTYSIWVRVAVFSIVSVVPVLATEAEAK